MPEKHYADQHNASGKEAANKAEGDARIRRFRECALHAGKDASKDNT
jgi:hypothetical protein